MNILGIDPGTATTGWGIIEKSNRIFTYRDAGIIATPAGLPMEKRLGIIFSDLETLIDRYHPQAFVIENLFFNTNAKTALLVGQARGVAILAAERNAVPVFSYTPLQVKLAITGYGRADKRQMQKMVQSLLKLPAIPKPDDAADALAIALTHGFTRKI